MATSYAEMVARAQGLGGNLNLGQYSDPQQLAASMSRIPTIAAPAMSSMPTLAGIAAPSAFGVMGGQVGGFLDDIGAFGGGGKGGAFGGMSGFEKAQLGVGAAGTLASMWSAWQASKLAKKSFNFQKDFANRNLENQTRTYNTGMDDRVGNRRAVYAGSANQMSAAQAQEYLDKNRLSTARVTGRG